MNRFTLLQPKWIRTTLSNFPAIQNILFSASTPQYSTTASATASTKHQQPNRQKKQWKEDGAPNLKDFMQKAQEVFDTEFDLIPDFNLQAKHPTVTIPNGRNKVYIETYGCQMNVSDSELVQSILMTSGYEFVQKAEDANVILVNTCSIRENAEEKVRGNLKRFVSMRNKVPERKAVIGILGCMAERLKAKLLEERLAHIVVGPDAYRDLPLLIQKVSYSKNPSPINYAMNVELSPTETYADITPMRLHDKISAYVTIMRGCDNMCSFCIVPFTRGRERSRPIDSILQEVKQLSEKGYKEIILLGQNVNSYNDTSMLEQNEDKDEVKLYPTAPGFTTVYKPKQAGVTFAELVDRVAELVPEIRIRFTSPHPKNFPDELLQVIRKRPNVCKFIHMPAQSGDTEMLQRMRRGYTREAYLDLVKRIRETIPNVAISSDFIAGFCGETEEEHKNTLDLLETVKYEHAFMFAYSMREKTHAHRNYKDDVPEDVKQRRLAEIIEVFRKNMLEKLKQEVGKTHLILVDGKSKKSDAQWCGRTDQDKTVLINDEPILNAEKSDKESVQVGDYIAVKVTGITGQTLIGEPIQKVSLRQYYATSW